MRDAVSILRPSPAALPSPPLPQVTRSGTVMSIKLGDDTLEYAEAFRLYMTTELTNPHYVPETRVKVRPPAPSRGDAPAAAHAAGLLPP
jgi:hypothetical protein